MRRIEDAKARQYTSTANLEARVELHRRFTPHGHDLQDLAWNLYEFAFHARVVDVGCGTGDFWTHHAARTPENLRLTLTDKSPAMIAAARQRLVSGDVHYAQADAAALPFADGRQEVKTHGAFEVTKSCSLFICGSM